MANPFSKMKSSQAAGIEQTTDYVGGGRGPLDTNMYLATLKALYTGQSQNGAVSVTLLADVEGREYSETFYITNAKGENTYTKDGKTHLNPNFVLINNICQLVLGVELPEVEMVEKTLEVWDFEARAKVKKKLDCIDGVNGEKVYLAIRHELVNKEEKGSDGVYAPIAETRNINRVLGAAHAEMKITVVEGLRAETKGEVPVAAWFDAWIKNNVNKEEPTKPYDNRKLKDGAGTAGAPRAGRQDNGPPTADGSAPVERKAGGLFNKNK